MRYDISLYARDRQRATANCGSRVIDDRVLSVTSKGYKTLVQTGTTSLYDRIQSHAQAVDLAQVLRRFAAGDTTALDRTVGEYVDVTSLPSDLRGLIDRARQADAILSQLSPEAREALEHGDLSVLGQQPDAAPVSDDKEVATSEP